MLFLRHMAKSKYVLLAAAAICGMITGPANAGRDLVPLNGPRVPDVRCDGDLVAHPVPSERVLDLGQSFQPHRQSLNDDGQVVAVSQRTLEVDRPGTPLKVYQTDINDLVLIDRATGNIIANDFTLTQAANEYLKQAGGGEVSRVDLRYAALVPRRPLVAFSVSTTLGENHVLLHNYESGETKGLVKERVDAAHRRWVRVDHERFIVSYFSSHGIAGSRHAIYDLESGNNIEVDAGLEDSVRISSDGKSLLQSSNHPEGRDHYFVNTYVNVPARVATGPLNLSRLRGRIEFDGQIVASSADLKRIVIDRDHHRGHPALVEHSKWWLSPDLAVIEMKRDKAFIKALPGWKSIRSKIKQAAAEGLIVNVLGLKGEITPDGSTFALQLEFESSVAVQRGMLTQIFGFDQNWIGMWDLSKREGPMILTSRMLDTRLDNEPVPSALNPERIPRVWRRKFAGRLLPNGLLIVARAMVQELEPPLSDVVVKIGFIRSGEDKLTVLEHRTGPVNLDPHQSSNQWTGITKLEIGTSGQNILLDITGVGSRMIDLTPPRQPLLPASSAVKHVRDDGNN